MRVFLVAEPGLSALGSTVARGLSELGAVVGLDTSGADPGVLATEANRFEAGIFVALVAGQEPGLRCAYFESQRFRSEGGYWLARRITDALAASCKDVRDPVGTTYRLLRETRMAAVVCDVVGRDDIGATAALSARQPEVVAALVDGIRRGVEEPPTAGA